MNKQKMVFIFPHLPNPRMIKRIKALKDEFDVEVIYWDRILEFNKTNKIPEDVKVYPVKQRANEGKPTSRLGATLKVIKEILTLLKKVKPKYLYISKTDMLFTGLVHKLFRKKDLKIIYEVSDIHSLLLNESKSIFGRILSKLLIRFELFMTSKIDLLVVTSEKFYSEFYHASVTKNKLIFIPNTPNEELFKGITKRENDKFTIGFIGSIRYANQLKMLIDISEEININLLIAGKGIDFESIRDYSKNKSNVEIYGEYEYELEIKDLYESVDCTFSLYDASKKNVLIALPNRLYESIYSHTPLIVTKGTYLSEIVDEYNIGISIKFDDKEELKSAIELFKNEKNEYSNMLTNLKRLKRKWVLSEYNSKLTVKLKGLK